MKGASAGNQIHLQSGKQLCINISTYRHSIVDMSVTRLSRTHSYVHDGLRSTRRPGDFMGRLARGCCLGRPRSTTQRSRGARTGVSYVLGGSRVVLSRVPISPNLVHAHFWCLVRVVMLQVKELEARSRVREAFDCLLARSYMEPCLSQDPTPASSPSRRPKTLDLGLGFGFGIFGAHLHFEFRGCAALRALTSRRMAGLLECIVLGHVLFLISAQVSSTVGFCRNGGGPRKGFTKAPDAENSTGSSQHEWDAVRPG